MKTEETVRLENLLWKHTDQRKDFGCFEVTIGWYGRQRVDFMTIDSKNTVRCYEIKVTKSDFHSKHGHNFVGTFNYYVMPQNLYEELKDEIPVNIGVYTEKVKNNICCVKSQSAPNDWEIPDPPPEPTERPRIEWLRMLPDKEILMAMENSMGCSKCDDEDDPNCYQGCADGVLPWWHEVVTLEQFRKDVGLNNDTDS